MNETRSVNLNFDNETINSLAKWLNKIYAEMGTWGVGPSDSISLIPSLNFLLSRYICEYEEYIFEFRQLILDDKTKYFVALRYCQEQKWDVAIADIYKPEDLDIISMAKEYQDSISDSFNKWKDLIRTDISKNKSDAEPTLPKANEEFPIFVYSEDGTTLLGRFTDMNNAAKAIAKDRGWSEDDAMKVLKYNLPE